MPEETFEQKVKKAAEQHPRSAKRARENAEKERARYKSVKSRPATKSD
jgi:hypothetical protein